MGVFRALMNDAMFLKLGKEVKIQHQNLLYSAQELPVNNALSLVGFANRNSLPY